ncbi:FtsX-like permease family protein [Limibacter armeniacum]|uniref:ABC transporter permease n=1 Tax=Limibacter armeniacum TaxID=466084 RepID=UPI002FE60D80
MLTLFTFSPKRIKQAYKNAIDAFIGQNFIKILSNISMIGVGFGTAALVIVLSFFNGMEGVITGMYNRHNPELLITPHKGKGFAFDEKLQHTIESIEGIDAITEVIEDNALLIFGDKQKVINMKGVSDNYALQTQFDTTVVLGEPLLEKNGIPYILVGSGVYQELSVRLKDRIRLIQFWYPKRDFQGSMSPETAFNRAYIQAGGVFLAEPQFDQNTVIVPLSFAQKLLEYGNKVTALEIKPTQGYSAQDIQEQLESKIGEDFVIKTRKEQQSNILRALEIEKLFAFLTFVVILGIASFNVFFSLAMLAIEKKHDIQMLFAMGGTKKMIRNIFLLEGSIVAFMGAGLGLSFGFIVCFLQDKYKVITTGTFNTLMDAYPVEMRWQDFLTIGGVILFITVVASIVPANNASKQVS